MDTECEVELLEDQILRNPDGSIIHHPLQGLYGPVARRYPTHGYLTFAGHDLERSELLNDIRVFHLQFFNVHDKTDRGAWADPLRAQVLLRLSQEKTSWYLGVLPRKLDGANVEDPVPFQIELEFWQQLLGIQQISSVVVQSEVGLGLGKGFLPRMFFEIPNDLLVNAIQGYWPWAIPGHPVEGYNMPSGRIDLFRQWDGMPRDAHLFRSVIDYVSIAFYSFPAEHRHFVFVTNKLTLAELKQRLELESLQEQARKLCDESKTQ